MSKQAKSPAIDRALIDQLPEAALITAGGWAAGAADIRHVNARFCALTGYAATELEGHNTRRLHGPRSSAALLRTGLARPLPAREGAAEDWLHRKDGSAFFAQWNYRPLTDAADGPLLVVYRDHTEFWRQRDALLQSQKLETVGLLASGVAHDFNNLLSIINGYCEILMQKIGDQPAAAKDLREIHRAGLKASSIARQILEFSRRQQGDTLVINYNTLVREVSEILRRVCGEEIELELRLASDLGNTRLNPTHFHQVLLNLCFNARDVMPRGGRLTIRTRNARIETPPAAGAPARPAGAYVVADVIDEGPGIPAAQQENIFEAFFTTKPHGTGLGLPIAQRIARQAQGLITVDSKPGEGARFSLWLPETPEPEQMSTTVLSTLSVTPGHEAILLIEREEALRRMIAGILALDGYRVTEVADAEAAERTGISPQLIIVDTMTDAGRRLLQRFRAADPGLRLVSTADEPPVWPAEALAHRPKPFALSSLIEEVRRLLDANGK
jgi:two-component system cell cycle sensor histidine kinase/response regulator CckA